MLTKKEIMRKLKENEKEWKKLGVKKFILFGSYAKGKQSSASDIDLIAVFEEDKENYKNWLALYTFLEDLFKTKIDLLTWKEVQKMNPDKRRLILEKEVSMKERCILYLKQIVEEAENLISISQEITEDEFYSDWRYKRAVERCLEIIGEAVKRLPSEFRNNYPEVDWKKYNDIDYEKIWQIVKEEIPVLKEKILKIIEKD